MRKVAICATSIYPIKGFLDAYLNNIDVFGRKEQVTILLAGDNKSAPGTNELCCLAAKEGYDVRFLSIEWQRDYLSRFEDLKAIIPENSDNRRNVAFLLAVEEGADIIISVDDDNYPIEGIDFLGEHNVVGSVVELPEAVGHDGWFNLCSMLVPPAPQSRDERLYPRGFPYKKRHPAASKTGGTCRRKVGINVGLWIGDPDTDAVGRLYARPQIAQWDRRSVMLAPGVRSPINTQNTAVSREVMVAYYYVRMGVPLGGMRIDRFGDIFSGLFAQICVDAVGGGIRIGSPVSEHRRNAHNLLVDLFHEVPGMLVLEDLTEMLSSVRLPSNSCATAYRALSRELDRAAGQAQGFVWTPETRKYMSDVASYMRVWVDVMESFE